MSEMKVPPPAYDESFGTVSDHHPQSNYPPLPQFPSNQPNPTVNAQPALNNESQADLDEHLGPYPLQVFCPTCRQYVVTETKHVSGLFTWILIFLFILFGLFCGCCLLPLCVKSCKDVEHRCTQCRTYVGTYQRVFGTRRQHQRVPVRQA